MRALALLATLLATCSGPGDLPNATPQVSEAPTMEQLPEAVFGAWTHSREEDRDGVLVYRPNDYPFPPSRYRASFEIRRDGTFILHALAPDDSRDELRGRWETIGPNAFRVSFDDPKLARIDVSIVSAQRDRLELRSERLR